MVIFVQLCKHHLPQRGDQAVSSVNHRQPRRFAQNGTALPKTADCGQSTSIQLERDAALWKGQSGLSEKAKAAWLLRALTLKRQAMVTGQIMWQASLKPA